MPTACVYCIPVAEDLGRMFNRGIPQWEGIWRPPEFGSSFAPTAFQKHLERRDAQREAQRAVTVVGINPIVAGSKNEPCRSLHAFMPRAADLKECLVLALELDFAVVDSPRKIHDAVNLKKIVARQALILAGVKFRTLWRVSRPPCDFTSTCA